MSDYEINPSSNLPRIPLVEIFSDDDFNCRGEIAPMDVADLCTSIEKVGLQQPIVLQPIGDVVNRNPRMKPTHKFRIIAGHRRYKAFLCLNKPGTTEYNRIEAIVRTGLTEIDARVLNLSENFDRTDLDLLQEAKAIKALQEAGVPRDKVAKLINKSSSWVQVRFNLLCLPEDIQAAAAAGVINQQQVKQIYSLQTPEQQYEAIRRIKDAKIKGEKVDHVGKRKKYNKNTKKERKRPEMFDMIEVIAKNVGYGLGTRALAWASGEISTEDFYDDLKKENPNATYFPEEL